MADTHIKINSVTPRIQYTGNGVTTIFPYEFAIFDETDMVVYVDDDIVESGYTVTGAGETEGGTVVFDTAPDDGVKITLLRDVPIERVTDFQEGGTFRPKNLNDEFDRQTAFVQQVQEILDRSVKVGPTSDVDPEEVLSQVERIYGSIDNVDAVADNLTNIYAVASDLTNIDAVAGNQTNIDTVAGIASDVSTVASNTSNVSNVATNMSDVNDCATNMAAIQDAPNQAQSAADSAALAYQYGNDKINQTHISNCITHIPQDIKLELNNGTLTLKAGSKVYVPNGFESDGTTLKFDVVTLQNDTSGEGVSLNDKLMVFLNLSNSTITYRTVSTCESGSSHTLTNYYNWYDTTSNKIGSYGLNNFFEYWCSFPIAIVTDSTSGLVSIDQVFNGFGYIGSTVFALPGVKGLIPNGRNEDGTLKNIYVSIDSVKTWFNNGYTFTNFQIGVRSDVRLSVGQYSYDEKTNTTTEGLLIAGNISGTSGKIDNIKTKTTFHALDYNDKKTISGWGMPSGKYDDLTLGASGTTYTAPANGYFAIAKLSTGAGQMVFLGAPTIACQSWSSASNQYLQEFVPVKAGHVVNVSYSLGGATAFFRFVYAEGEQ